MIICVHLSPPSLHAIFVMSFYFINILSPHIILCSRHSVRSRVPVGTWWGKKERKENYDMSSNVDNCHFNLEIVSPCH